MERKLINPRKKTSSSAVKNSVMAKPKPPKTTITMTATSQNAIADCHRDFVEFHEGYVRSYVAFADTKAALSFGASAGLLSFLSAQEWFQKAILTPNFSVQFVQSATAATFLILAAIFAALVVTPRRNHSDEGLVFFDAVAQYASAEEYVKAITQKTSDELTTARIVHSYDVSKACSRKYDLVQKSISFGLLGFGSFLSLLMCH